MCFVEAIGEATMNGYYVDEWTGLVCSTAAAPLRILLGKEDFGETIDWVQRAMRAEAEITRLKQPTHT